MPVHAIICCMHGSVGAHIMQVSDELNGLQSSSQTKPKTRLEVLCLDLKFWVGSSRLNDAEAAVEGGHTPVCTRL